MTGPTHKQYSILFACLTVMLFYTYNVSQIGYFWMLIIVLDMSKHGALFPDLDHSWQNVGAKTVPNKIINTLIHVTGGKHRSWQTHSIDICAWFTIASIAIPKYLYSTKVITAVNREVMSMIMLGFASGWISHLFSDMLTSAGVRVVCFSKFKVKLVPKKIGKLSFNTGHEWEQFNYKLIWGINKIIGAITIIYPFILTNIQIATK